VGADVRTKVGGFPKTVAIGGAPKRYKLVYKALLTIDISPINHSYWSYKPTERYLGGTTLYGKRMATPRRRQVFYFEPQQFGRRMQRGVPGGQHLGGFGVAHGGAEGHVASPGRGRCQRDAQNGGTQPRINQGSSKDWKIRRENPLKAKDLVTGLWNDRTANIYR